MQKQKSWSYFNGACDTKKEIVDPLQEVPIPLAADALIRNLCKKVLHEATKNLLHN